jgi:hypothetical protein
MRGAGPPCLQRCAPGKGLATLLPVLVPVFLRWRPFAPRSYPAPLAAAAAAATLRPLVSSVRGPQQAQQAWDVVRLLASRPLPQRAAERVANCAVLLVEVRRRPPQGPRWSSGKQPWGHVPGLGSARWCWHRARQEAGCCPETQRYRPSKTASHGIRPGLRPSPAPRPARPPAPPQLSLNKGDYTILHALLSGRQRFAFGRRSVEALIRAACTADVELGELNAILRAAPPGALSDRAFFFLIKSFEARGQVAEALHCHHQMQVLGLEPTPALEATLRKLKDGRAAAARASLAAHR